MLLTTLVMCFWTHRALKSRCVSPQIMSFAKIWTGFDYQQGRGNVEESSWSGNRHDPMKIQAGWRDKFPKTDMTGGYIGDGYPLCVSFIPSENCSFGDLTD